jgi:hypothetical protein
MAASAGNRQPFLRAMLARGDVNTVDGDTTSREAVASFLRKQGRYTPHVVQSVETVERFPGLFSPIDTNQPVERGAVRLVEVNAVQPGSPVDGAQSEWFVVRNNGAETVDLEGYRFSDADEGGEFTVKQQLVLQPGEQIMFCHSLAALSRLPYAGDPYQRLFEYGPLAERMVLGDGGDELIVVAPDGSVSDQVAYGDNTGYWPVWPTNSLAPWHPPGTSLQWTGAGWAVSEQPLSQK